MTFDLRNIKATVLSILDQRAEIRIHEDNLRFEIQVTQFLHQHWESADIPSLINLFLEEKYGAIETKTVEHFVGDFKNEHVYTVLFGKVEDVHYDYFGSPLCATRSTRISIDRKDTTCTRCISDFPSAHFASLITDEICQNCENYAEY